MPKGIDERNAEMLATLRPATRARFERLLAALHPRGIRVLITEARRTQKRQDELFALGNTKPSTEPCRHGAMRREVGTCAQHPLGARVTKSRMSWHVTGRACDFAILDPSGKPTWPENPLTWQPIVELAGEQGLTWGFSLWRWDMPHFMDTLDANGQSMTLARAMREEFPLS